MAVEKNAADYEIIVLGDFNDYDGDTCCEDHIASDPITTVLSDIKSMSENNNNDDLENIAAHINKSERYIAFPDGDIYCQ